MIRLSGIATNRTIKPDAKAVARQPFDVSDQAMIGAMRPATLRPSWVMANASERRRSNQFTTTVVAVMNPQSEAPNDVIKKRMKKVVRESTRLKAIKPSPKINAPTCITRRGLNRSINAP